MKTDAQKRAQNKYEVSLADRGVKSVRLRLEEKTRKRLADLAKSYGSQSRVVDVIIGGD